MFVRVFRVLRTLKSTVQLQYPLDTAEQVLKIEQPNRQNKTVLAGKRVTVSSRLRGQRSLSLI